MYITEIFQKLFHFTNDNVYRRTPQIVNPKLDYSGGERGWIGDNPFIYLDTRKIRGLGWKPKLGIRQAVLKTVEFLRRNEWVFEEMG